MRPMNSQTIREHRALHEYRRLEDIEGHQPRRPVPWYCRKDAREILLIALAYLAVVIGLFVGLPFALNWFCNLLNRLFW